MKLMRSDKFTVTSMYGIDNESEGMKRARKNGLKTFGNGIDGIYDLDESERPQILFDATSAGAHEYNNKVAQELGIRMIDLTPAAVGPFVSPSVNLDEFIEETNVNMITCGGQATAPIVAAISDVVPVKYAEIVDGKFDEEEVVASIREREKEIQSYVPGYSLQQDPVINGDTISVFVQVEGAGDFLPVYSGNLDIMTASAVGVAERVADYINEKEGKEVEAK